MLIKEDEKQIGKWLKKLVKQNILLLFYDVQQRIGKTISNLSIHETKTIKYLIKQKIVKFVSKVQHWFLPSTVF